MEKLLKLMAGLLWTAGFILCPPPNASAPKHTTVVSDWSEQVALKNAIPDHASASEPLYFPPSQPLKPAATPSQSGSANWNALSFSLWSSGEKSALAEAGNSVKGADLARFEQLMRIAQTRSLHERPMGEIVQAIADQLLGSTYQANLLDQSAQETLVISLTQFDCVLFVETVLALARGVATQDYSYQTFANHIQNQRYRDGKLNGYCSRLHYFSDWVADNQQRGNVLDIATDLGGLSMPKVLNFMSTHSSSYAPLATSQTTYRCIQRMESHLNPLTIHYIPQNQIRQQYARLQPGDIVAIATRIPGLDVTHTGLVYRNPNGGIGLIHASPGSGVKISPDLQRYVNNVGDQIGILVARPVDPRMPISRL